MAANRLQQRTSEVLSSYRASRNSIIGDDGNCSISAKDVTRFNGFAREAVRLLREIKTDCVREEAQSAERITGRQDDEPIDLGYSAVKLEIDAAIDEVLADRMRVSPSENQPDDVDAHSQVVEAALVSAGPADRRLIDRLERLADLRAAGALTDDEFAVAKASLLVED